MRQTILVPTDFSKNALVAAHYALELAQQLQADIHILHAYRSFTSAFQSTSANEADTERAKTDAEKGLIEFIGQLKRVPGTTISSETTNGSILDVVTQHIDKNNVSLVVMGAHGNTGTRRDLLGTNTYDVAKDVTRPLLIVPEHTNSFKLDNVVFFSDYQEGDVKSFRQFIHLFGKAQPSCTLVHIHEEEDEPIESDRQKLGEWKDYLEQEVVYEGLHSELIHVPENVESVNTVLDRLQADMTLITLVDMRGFFKKILHKSLARTIILNPHTPVLLTSEDTERL